MSIHRIFRRPKPISRTAKTVSILLLTLLGVAMTWLGIYTIRVNSGRDLSRANHINGRIATLGVVSRQVRTGIRPFRLYWKTDFLEIRLSRNPVNLATFIPGQDYSGLLDKLHPGDSVSVYYYPTEDITNNIYQLEKANEILVSHAYYKKQDTRAGIVILCLGIFIFAMEFVFIRIFRRNRR